MRILITNDDGIAAPGLAVLEGIAAQLADAKDIWVVAPAFEQSGVGHCVSYLRPMMIQKIGPQRIACEGTPADCVLSGVHEVLDSPPDLVLSGVNRGNNSAENALYSGTLGGAMEGALQGLPAIALSQFYGPRNVEAANPFEAAAAHGAALVQKLYDKMRAEPKEGYRTFFNVNFPPVPAAEVLGTRIARQGIRPGQGFHTEPMQSPSGRNFLWIRGSDQQARTAPGSDAAVNLDGYISVTPMRADLTDHTQLDALADLNT